MLYERFADAWRVTDATTLFDYDPGKGTATYTIRDYPSPPKVAGLEELDPAKAAAGRAACATVTDAALQAQCAFDVAVTGDTGYVRPYKAIEQVAEQGTVAARTRRVAVANPPVEVLPVIHQLAGAALGPDGTLYLSVVMADRSGRVLAIDPLTGRILHQVATTGAGEVAVSAGSVWVGEFSAPATGGFQPCSVSRLDPATLAVQATIPTACHRVWSRTDLAAVGDDVWFVDPTAADATGAGASLRRIDTATNAVAGPRSRSHSPTGRCGQPQRRCSTARRRRVSFDFAPGKRRSHPSALPPQPATRMPTRLATDCGPTPTASSRCTPPQAGRTARSTCTMRMGVCQSRLTRRACTSSGRGRRRERAVAPLPRWSSSDAHRCHTADGRHRLRADDVVLRRRGARANAPRRRDGGGEAVDRDLA